MYVCGWYYNETKKLKQQQQQTLGLFKAIQGFLSKYDKNILDLILSNINV